MTYNLGRWHMKFVANIRKDVRRRDDPTKVYRDLILADVKKQIIHFKDFQNIGLVS